MEKEDGGERALFRLRSRPACMFLNVLFSPVNHHVFPAFTNSNSLIDRQESFNISSSEWTVFLLI